MKTRNIHLILFLTTGLLACNSKEYATTKLADKYEIIQEIKSETTGKAQLLEYAVYKDSVFEKETLESIVSEIYDLNSKKNVFDQHQQATAIAVYLFTSKSASIDKSNWIAMLIKSPNDIEPRITINEFKLNSMAALADNVESPDEIELNRLKTLLAKKGLDLCSVSEQLKKIELNNIHLADAKYPDFGKKHVEMIDMLDENAYQNLSSKFGLNRKDLEKIPIFAMSYCK